MSLISIIIPIYNKEKNLEKCLNSIINQTFINIEIILINDGSTDKSRNIGEYYKKKYRNIKLVNIENSGVSAARNTGLLYATGKYIQFVDADDYLETNTCELLINSMKKEDDMVICGYKIINNNKEIYHYGPTQAIKSTKELSVSFPELYKNGFLNSPCNKLYRKNLIKNEFDETISLGEDLLFNLNYMKNIKNINIIRDCLYNYRMENNASLTAIYRENAFDIAKLLDEKVKKFINIKFDTNIDIAVVNSVFISNFLGILQRYILNSNNTVKQKQKKIFKWINDEKVIDTINEVEIDKFEAKLILYLIRHKLTLLILFYYKSKLSLKKIKNWRM